MYLTLSLTYLMTSIAVCTAVESSEFGPQTVLSVRMYTLLTIYIYNHIPNYR